MKNVVPHSNSIRWPIAQRLLLGVCVCVALLSTVGCQCYRPTRWYSRGIDRVADSKARLDRLYVPGLDVSRTGMPDWRRFGINRVLCPGDHSHCHCRRKPVYYPAEYRQKYWIAQAAAEESAASAADPLPLPPSPDAFPAVETAPLPLPAVPAEAIDVPLPE